MINKQINLNKIVGQEIRRKRVIQDIHVTVPVDRIYYKEWIGSIGGLV